MRIPILGIILISSLVSAMEEPHIIIPLSIAKYTLFERIKAGDALSVQALLEHMSTNISNITDDEGNTPLHLAVQQKASHIASLLLKHHSARSMMLTGNPIGSPMRKAISNPVMLRALVEFENEQGISSLSKPLSGMYRNIVDQVLWQMNEDPTWETSYAVLLQHRHFQLALDNLSNQSKAIHSRYMQRRMPS